MRPALACLALLALAACDPGDGRTSVKTATTEDGAVTSGVEVRDAWCRPTPNGLDATACYLTLTAAVDDRLVAVASPISDDIQIHDMVIDGEIMRMSEITDGLPLPAGQTVSLSPGGKHLMVLGLTAPTQVGQTVDLSLRFETTTPLTVQAAVRVGPATHATH